MTKRKTLGRSGNYPGTKPLTGARGAKGGIGSSSKMEAVNESDLSDLTQAQLTQIVDAYAKAANIRGDDKEMLSRVIAGDSRERFANNLERVLAGSPDDLKREMGDHGVYLSRGNPSASGAPKDSGQITSAAAGEDISRQNVDELATGEQRKMSGRSGAGRSLEGDRVEEVVDAYRDALTDSDPDRRAEKYTHAREKMVNANLSSEDMERAQEAMLRMLAEEYSLAVRHGDDGVAKEVNNILGGLSEEDVDKFHELVIEQDKMWLLKAAMAKRAAQRAAAGEEGDDVQDNNTPDSGEGQEVVNGTGDESTQSPEAVGDVLSNFARELRASRAPVERRFESKNLDEAKETLQKIIDAHPKLVASVNIGEIDKNLPESERKKLEEQTTAAIDALSQHISELPEDYVAVLDEINIVPSKKWKDLTPEEYARRRAKYSSDKLKAEIANREWKYYASELNAKTDEELRDIAAERVLDYAAESALASAADRYIERMGLSGDAAAKKREELMQSDKFKEMRAAKLVELQQLAQGDKKAQFDDSVKKFLNTQEAVLLREELFRKNAKEKFVAIYNSEAAAQEAEDRIRQSILEGVGTFAEVNDNIGTLNRELKNPRYTGSAVLNVNPGINSDSDFNEWHARLAHEMGHLKSMAWADNLLSCLTAVKTGKTHLSDESGAIEVMNFSGDAATVRGVEAARAPEFEAFVEDWEKVSLYQTGETTVNGEKLPVWQLKPGVDKERAAKIVTAAFGLGYAGEEAQTGNAGVMAGRGVREELAEAHRIYSHPKRDEYVKALRAGGNNAAADYLEGMFGVIEKYDHRVKEGQVPQSYKNMASQKKSKKTKAKKKA